MPRSFFVAMAAIAVATPRGVRFVRASCGILARWTRRWTTSSWRLRGACSSETAAPPSATPTSPRTTARATLHAAGDALVEQKIVSREQMNRIFGNTTLSQDERRIARKLIRHAHDAVERHGLGRAAKNAVAEFANAVAVETYDKQRI